MNCPHCGLAITVAPTRRARPLDLYADTSQLSDTEIHAHFKQISHAADAAFFANAIRKCGDRRLILSAETVALQAAAGTLSRPDTFRQLHRLQAIWRGLDYRKGGGQ